MITITASGVAVEWIFWAGNDETLGKYPGNLDADMSEVRKRLDKYTASPTPQNSMSLEKAAQRFQEKSLKAFNLDWNALHKEFETQDPQLADITRLFSDGDSAANRALILLRIWRNIQDLSKFEIRDPSEQIE
jgi:hypothetical protein